MAVILDKQKRDELLNKLDSSQKEFLMNHVKRGKKTMFANVMAKDKGMVLPENMKAEELEYLLDEWVLLDYIDNGFINNDTPCECGRPLRYQYIVKHNSTNEIRRFGITHFEEHTGLSAEIVKQIKDGFLTIEYELDELLMKIDNNWFLERELPMLPEELKYDLAKDIQLHLSIPVPLLDRQMQRVKQQLNKYNGREIVREQPKKVLKTIASSFEEEEKGPVNLFNEPIVTPNRKQSINNPYILPFSYREHVTKYLQEGVRSTRIICELLIKKHQASKKRYTSQKPKIYASVCFYLDYLVQQGEVVFIGTDNLDDRYYEWKKE